MPSFSLSDLNAAADKQYGNFEIPVNEDEVLVFLNPLRLDKDRRVRMAKLFQNGSIQDRLEVEPDLDMYDLYREAFEIAAVNEGTFKRLTEIVGDSPAKWTVLFAEFNGTSELGEASTSGN